MGTGYVKHKYTSTTCIKKTEFCKVLQKFFCVLVKERNARQLRRKYREMRKWKCDVTMTFFRMV